MNILSKVSVSLPPEVLKSEAHTFAVRFAVLEASQVIDWSVPHGVGAVASVLWMPIKNPYQRPAHRLLSQVLPDE